MSGNLYIVGTPIGNLDDITLRAIEILDFVDIVACEDSRITKRLFNKYNINSKTIIYNDYNAKSKKEIIVKKINEGFNVALVCDAGTPCISDPGYRLVNYAHKNNISVFTIPGASSVHSALSISGLPTDCYYFEGFLPKKKGRQTKFNYLSNLECSIVIFESPYRLIKTLNDINFYMENRVVSICKEMTKIYENVFIGKILDLLADFDSNKIKGEYVIIIAKKGYEY